MTLCHLLLFPSVRPSVWFGVGIRSQAHHDRHHQCLSPSASAVPQGLSGVTESDGGGNTWVNLDCEIFICLMKGSVI